MLENRSRGSHACDRVLMLPVTFQFLIAMVAHALNERMARRVLKLHQ